MRACRSALAAAKTRRARVGMGRQYKGQAPGKAWDAPGPSGVGKEGSAVGAGEEDGSVVVCCIVQLHSFSSQGLFFQIPHEQSAAQPFFTLSVNLQRRSFKVVMDTFFPQLLHRLMARCSAVKFLWRQSMAALVASTSHGCRFLAKLRWHDPRTCYRFPTCCSHSYCQNVD